eukprot:187797-Hanusia_phi.AAC.4
MNGVGGTTNPAHIGYPSPPASTHPFGHSCSLIAPHPRFISTYPAPLPTELVKSVPPLRLLRGLSGVHLGQ